MLPNRYSAFYCHVASAVFVTLLACFLLYQVLLLSPLVSFPACTLGRFGFGVDALHSFLSLLLSALLETVATLANQHVKFIFPFSFNVFV